MPGEGREHEVLISFEFQYAKIGIQCSPLKSDLCESVLPLTRSLEVYQRQAESRDSRDQSRSATSGELAAWSHIVNPHGPRAGNVCDRERLGARRYFLRRNAMRKVRLYRKFITPCLAQVHDGQEEQKEGHGDGVVP
jgi:hypothetical protein